MIAREPITLPEVEGYLEEITALADRANAELSLCLRARMAVSAGAQEVAYAHLAQVGTLITEIYQAGDGSDKGSDKESWRSKIITGGVPVETATSNDDKSKSIKKKRPKTSRGSVVLDRCNGILRPADFRVTALPKMSCFHYYCLVRLRSWQIRLRSWPILIGHS